MTLMCIERSQSPTHKGSFLQGGKSSVSNINNQHNANHRRNSSIAGSVAPMPLLIKNVSSQLHDNFAKSNANSDSKKLERSCSDSGNDRRVVQSNSSRYKTELCRPFEENGTCKYGDKCQFAHGKKELRSMIRHPKYKTELCRTFHTTGLCPYGPRCHFIHNSEQNKKSLLTTLTAPALPRQEESRPCLGSDGEELSPPSSHGGSPTETKSFEDIFLPLNSQSPIFNNGVFNHNAHVSRQRMIEGASFDCDSFDAINMFHETNMFHENFLFSKNYYHNERTLDYGPISPPIENNPHLFQFCFSDVVVPKV